MGMWDLISSTTDAVKRNSPDLTPVKNACWSTYGYTWSAVTKIDNAVRANFNYGLDQYKPDDETVAKIGRFATFFAKNTVDYAWQEGLKCVPGGKAFSKIVSQTRHSEREYQANNSGRPEKEPNGWKKSPEQAEIHKLDTKLTSQNALRVDSYASQKPEDAIRIFMMKKFVGGNILGDLLVPKIRHGRNGTGRGEN